MGGGLTHIAPKPNRSWENRRSLATCETRGLNEGEGERTAYPPRPLWGKVRLRPFGASAQCSLVSTVNKRPPFRDDRGPVTGDRPGTGDRGLETGDWRPRAQSSALISAWPYVTIRAEASFPEVHP